MLVTAIVVAAGRGQRFGGAKQFAELDGLSLAARSVVAARSVASIVVLVVPNDYDGVGEGADVVTVGGESRSDSVRAGLAHARDSDVVVIHDAARPWATADLFRSVVDAVHRGADGAVPGLALTDTVKKVSADQPPVVVATVAREDLVAVQTPQAFRAETLRRAHASGAQATDDAALVELLGAKVVVVPGEVANVKVTHASDLDGVTTESARA